jgi:hypothetical protein
MMSTTTDSQLDPIGDVEEALSSIGALDMNKGNHLVHTLTKASDLQL